VRSPQLHPQLAVEAFAQAARMDGEAAAATVADVDMIHR